MNGAYKARPLNGIWATAPYLHNGSVPTLNALLNSRSRPVYWRTQNPREYDRDNLGWRFETLEKGHADEDDPAARKRIYDSTLRGYANTGHDYSDSYTETERQALIEYLKTL